MIKNKYTFLLPAYKAKFFEAALRSIKVQSFKSFKCLVSDDCSNENLKYVFDKVCNGDSRFEYRRNKINMGAKSLVEHWNLLVDLCDTEYLILASDDDIYEVNFLEEIDKLSEKYPEVDLLHARARIIDENNIIRKEDAIYEERVSQINFLTQYEYYNHIECIANYVFKTKALKNAGRFVDTPLAWYSDTATTFLLSKNGAVNTKNILFNFRMSGYNISSLNRDNKDLTKKKFQAVLCFSKFLEKFLENLNVGNNLLLENEKYSVMELHKRRIISEACYYSSALSLCEFLRFVKTFKKNKYINNVDIYIYLKKWIYDRLS